MSSVTPLLLITVLLTVLNCCCFSKAAPSLNLETVAKNPGGSKCVYLKNVEFDEYLYAAQTSYAFDESNNRVFTWKKKSDGHPSNWGNVWGIANKDQGKWLLVKENFACENCYAIRSVYYKEHQAQPLYSTSSQDPEFKKLSPRRPVYTYSVKADFPRSQGRHIWQLVNVPGYPDRVWIKSKNIRSDEPMEEYLYAAIESYAYDKDRRNVFTWSSTTEADKWGKTGDWIMEDAGDCGDITYPLNEYLSY